MVRSVLSTSGQVSHGGVHAYQNVTGPCERKQGDHRTSFVKPQSNRIKGAEIVCNIPATKSHKDSLDQSKYYGNECANDYLCLCHIVFVISERQQPAAT